jgi:outer membrane protein assembly factor BamB
VEPKTGKVIWQGELPSKAKIEASPSAADGKIYATNFWGEVFVVKAGGDKFELLNVADFGNDSKATRGDSVVRSGIAIANGDLFIRVQDRLYCVGK